MLVLSFLCEDRRGILLWAKFRLHEKETLPHPEQEGEKKGKKTEIKQSI